MPLHRFWQLLAKKNSGEALPSEIEELEELMRLHPEWHYSAQHIQDIWGLNMKEDPLAAEEAFQNHLNKMKKSGINLEVVDDDAGHNFIINSPSVTNRRLFKKVLTGVFVAGLAVLSFLFTKEYTSKPVSDSLKVSEVSTRMGSRSSLVLPDGSKVWLNAGSKLTYNKNFGTRHREVTLSGEAYFDVTKSAELPFVIQTPTMQVKVLGTAFNVKSYPGEMASETSVIRGSVEIIPTQRPDQKYVLRQNEKLVVANREEQVTEQKKQPKPMIALVPLTYYSTDSVIVETSWVENRLVFDNEPFTEVALKMERWFDVKIEFRNRQLQETHLTGSFINETVHEALKALQISTDFVYEIREKKVIISK
ncbi:MAG TPA: FecR family protein [Chitinophagaceae bacterium]